MKKNILDTVLLLALPASGKSEVRKYLRHVPADVCEKDFHMGPTVQLDDFPYVHMMRRIDDEVVNLGGHRVYFHAPDKPFKDPRDWGTLIALVNEDYEDLVTKKKRKVKSAADRLLKRLDTASGHSGAGRRLEQLSASIQKSLTQTLEKESRDMMENLEKNYPDTLEGKTLVIEFARGGPDGAALPLPAPLGYQYSIGQLSEELLKKAVVLYVWVTPEESRRKNTDRSDPNDPGSILHHSVPIEVMMKDYGCDDMDWLEKNSDKPGAIAIHSAGGRKFHLPVARFDNRVDKTSFLRADPAKWPHDKVKAVHHGLKEALDKLAGLVPVKT